MLQELRLLVIGKDPYNRHQSIKYNSPAAKQRFEGRNGGLLVPSKDPLHTTQLFAKVFSAQ
jgi:hypothetical protein